MNPITRFFHEFLNPHCEHCELREEVIKAERDHCNTCEALKIELSKSHQLNEQLMDKLLDKPETTEPRAIPQDAPKPIQTRHIPWPVRRQMLEQDSREKANALRNAAKPDSPKSESIKELEKELGISTELESAEG